jgi:hypothetical protein
MDGTELDRKTYEKFTNSPWLDGVIYGSAYGEIKKGFALFLGTLPISCVETLARSFQAAGYSVQYSGVLDNTSVEDDHVLDITEGSSSFKNLHLPTQRFVNRDYSEDFIDGYIFSRLFPVFRRAETSKKNDLTSLIQLRLKSEVGNAETLIEILGARGIEAKKIHDGCVEIPSSSFGEGPFDAYITELTDELESHTQKEKAVKIKDWQERSYGKIDIDLPEGKLIQDILSPFAISHLSRKAGLNNKLSSRERGAIRGIATLLINRRKPSDKQRQYLEGLIKKSLILGLANDACDRDSCRMCQELRDFTVRFKITDQSSDKA